jgi:hypothetical protein
MTNPPRTAAPPHSRHSERVLLAGLFREPDLVTRACIRHGVAEGDLFFHPHRVRLGVRGGAAGEPAAGTDPGGARGDAGRLRRRAGDGGVRTAVGLAPSGGREGFDFLPGL